MSVTSKTVKISKYLVDVSSSMSVVVMALVSYSQPIFTFLKTQIVCLKTMFHIKTFVSFGILTLSQLAFQHYTT